MSFNPKSLTIIAGIAALSLSVIGCNGQVPGNTGYVPTSTNAASLIDSGVGADHHKKKIDIESNCGSVLRIVIAGLVNCKFHEKGYNGSFTVANDTKGIVLVTPSSGPRTTPFTIVGLVLGTGKLVWSDSNGKKFNMRVRVTL